MKKRLLLALLCLLTSFLLAACGGGDGEDGSAASEEARIEREFSVTGGNNDPSACSESTTPAYLEQTTGLTGEAGIERCEKEMAEQRVVVVDFFDVEVDGDRATAEAAYEGGEFDGDTVQVGLVEEDGTWKYDERIRFTQFNRAGFLRRVERSFEQNAGLPSRDIPCFLERIEQLTDAELEEVALTARRSDALAVELVTACSQARG